MNKNNNQYSEEELIKWEKCYGEAGRAVLTDFLYNDHGVSDKLSIADDLTIATHIVEEFHECIVTGNYVAKEHVQSELGVCDRLDILLAGFLAERLCPSYDAIDHQRGFSALYEFELDSAKEIGRHISSNPYSACFVAGTWVWHMLDKPSIQTAVHDLAKFLFLSEDETTAGERIDEIIAFGTLHGEWVEAGRDPDSLNFPWARLSTLAETLGWEQVQAYWPEDCAELDARCEEVEERMVG